MHNTDNDAIDAYRIRTIEGVNVRAFVLGGFCTRGRHCLGADVQRLRVSYLACKIVFTGHSYSAVLPRAILCVCLSVSRPGRSTVTRQYCVKTHEGNMMMPSSLADSPITRVFDNVRRINIFAKRGR